MEWVLEWSHGVESWSGIRSGMKSDFGVIFALLGQDLVLIGQFLVNAYSYGALYTCQALNICFIIGRQM